MKAAIFQGIGKPMVVEDRPDPSPGPGEVVIRVGRAGICGSDLHMTSEPGSSIAVGTIMGHEFAGEIVALGKEGLNWLLVLIAILFAYFGVIRPLLRTVVPPKPKEEKKGAAAGEEGGEGEEGEEGVRVTLSG